MGWVSFVFLSLIAAAVDERRGYPLAVLLQKVTKVLKHEL
jgi:hypothetical protein